MDPKQIQQVFLNLTLNAVQAMSGGGTLSIRTDRVSREDGVWIRIGISDTGPGIPPQILEKIFTPFFTTKAQGTGLGLAICHKLITQHHGTITVRSEDDKGTEFVIFLPAVSIDSSGDCVITGISRVIPKECCMRKVRILVVDDEHLIRWSLEQNLKKQGYDVLTAGSGEDALRLVREEQPDLVLLDIQLPGISGMEVLEKIKEFDDEIIVIMVTAHGGLETAVNAMRVGAYDYINKPFNLDEMAVVIKKALETFDLRREVARLRSEHKKSGPPDIIGTGLHMRNILDMMGKVARSDASTVLVLGESGTGKELVAKWVHYQSARADKPFIAINCAAVPATLLESELFGHEKGSFTDAKNAKKGLFELADGGTVFLDEIGDMEMGMQAKLLRFLEDRTFRRIGGAKVLSVDVRIISATNKDLLKAIEDKSFRNDLYYRLQVIPDLPPAAQGAAGGYPPDRHALHRVFQQGIQQAGDRDQQRGGASLPELPLARQHPRIEERH